MTFAFECTKTKENLPLPAQLLFLVYQFGFQMLSLKLHFLVLVDITVSIMNLLRLDHVADASMVHEERSFPRIASL